MFVGGGGWGYGPSLDEDALERMVHVYVPWHALGGRLDQGLVRVTMSSAIVFGLGAGFDWR